MIAVDTNVLVRLLVNDDPAQAVRAKKLFDRQATDDRSIWVADSVLVELVWTLSHVYSRPKADLVAALRGLAAHATLDLESAEVVAAAIESFEGGPADFADCLLAEKVRRRGCAQLMTFGRGMRALPGVTLL